jgi:hypothetical protein
MKILKTSLAFLPVLLAVALAATAPPAHAGRSCEARKTTPQTVERGMTLAEKTLASLNASGDKVVVLARAGQDLGKYGIRYSHLGLAYQLPDGQGGMTWRVVHKLNTCGTSESAVYRQGLGEFFLDDLWRFEAAWVAPSPESRQSCWCCCRTRPANGHAPQALQHRELCLGPQVPAVQPVGD